MSQFGSLCSLSTSTFSLIKPHNLPSSSLSPFPSFTLPSSHTVPKPRKTSIFLGLKPILCSSSTLSPELHEEEISTTRLLAQNVPWTSTASDIRALFEKHGTVLDVEVSMHNKTRNRGLAFVEMGSPEEAAEALAKLESFEYEGRLLKLTYAKMKKRPSEQPKPPVLYNLFVANLSFEARAKDLREFFSSGGFDVAAAEVIFHDTPRKSSGYGFVSFKWKKQADEALSTFQGKELMGRPVRLERSNRFVKLETEVNSLSEDNQDTGEPLEQPESVDNL